MAKKKTGRPRRKQKLVARRGAVTISEVAKLDDLRKELERATGSSSPLRWNADPDDVQRSVAQLVLTLVEFIRKLLERQAIRRMEAGTLTDEQSQYDGIWHSTYRYHSSSRKQTLQGEHYVVMRQQGSQLLAESLPVSNESVLRLELTLNGLTATGTWSERTAPSGYYRGRTYHGAIQLVIDPMGKSMTGKWVGMDREFNVNSDTWELHWIDEASSPLPPHAAPQHSSALTAAPFQ